MARLRVSLLPVLLSMAVSVLAVCVSLAAAKDDEEKASKSPPRSPPKSPSPPVKSPPPPSPPPPVKSPPPPSPPPPVIVKSPPSPPPKPVTPSPPPPKVSGTSKDDKKGGGDKDKEGDDKDKEGDDKDKNHSPSDDDKEKGGGKAECEDKVAVGNCPTFSCTAGSTFAGKFYGGKGDSDHADGFFKLHLDPSLSGNPQLDCYKACAQFNLANSGKAKAAYFQYEPTPEDKGGNCQCFGADACTGSHYAALPAGVKGFTVGKICSSDGKGDPHFRGADGSRYDFSGVPNHAYSLISDSHLQLNAYFGGRFGEYNGNPHKSLTWMRSLAFLFGHNVLVIEARAGPSSEYESGYLARMTLNGDDVAAPGVGDRLSLLDGQLEVVQIKGGEMDGSDLIDEFEVRVGESLLVRLLLRPEVEALRTEDDGLVHFEVDVVKVQLSSHAHGILGQTYRPDFAGRIDEQKLEYSSLLDAMVIPGDNADGFLDGSVDDYQTSSIDRADCRMCRFTRAEGLQEDEASAATVAAGASVAVISSFTGVTGPRKALMR